MGLFDWGYARTQIFLVSWNQYGSTLVAYRNTKSATLDGEQSYTSSENSTMWLLDVGICAEVEQEQLVSFLQIYVAGKRRFFYDKP